MELQTSSKVHVTTKQQQRIYVALIRAPQAAIPLPLCVSMREAFTAHFQPVFPQPSTSCSRCGHHASAAACTHRCLSTRAEHPCFAIGFCAAPRFAAFDTALQAALDSVFFEGGWSPAPAIGRLLMPAFPMPNQTWTVLRDAWHADEPTFVDRDTPMGMLAFVFLDDVQPKGGATVVLSGSPRLSKGGPAGRPRGQAPRIAVS